MPVNRKRLSKPVQQTSLDFEGTLKSAFLQIRDLIETYGEDAAISLETEPYGDSQRLYLYTKVTETDKEYEERVKKEEHYEKLQLERDKKEYERLAKLFGGQA